MYVLFRDVSFLNMTKKEKLTLQEMYANTYYLYLGNMYVLFRDVSLLNMTKKGKLTLQEIYANTYYLYLGNK